MRTGNHARKDYYQPGAVLYRDTDTVYTGAGDFTEATTGAYTALSRRLHIAYTTPPVDCIAEIFAQVSCSHSTDSADVRFSVRNGVGGAIAVTGYAEMGTKTVERTWNGVAYVELTKSTAYDWEVFFYQSAAQLTVVETAPFTFLQMVFIRIP